MFLFLCPVNGSRDAALADRRPPGLNHLTADSGGGGATTQLYKAWGEVRTGSINALATRYTFTGQAAEEGLGLMFYHARWYDPLLGRFISADTIVPSAYNPPSYDRYSYVRSNPLRYVDPSGHKACIEFDEIGKCIQDPDWHPNQTYRPSWRNDPGYDPESDSIPDWGDNWEETYMDRAEKVYGWMCATSGWWGTGCPGAYDLTAWLLQHEAGALLNDAIYYNPRYKDNAQKGVQLIVTYTLYRFGDGVQPRADLGKYTSFYNPGTDSPSFNKDDWKFLNTAPSKAAYNTVNVFMIQAYPYSGRDLVWWDEADAHAPPYTEYLFVTNPIGLHFALK